MRELFPEASDNALQVRISEMLGPLPEYILQKAQHTNKYFRVTEMPTPPREGGLIGRSQTQYTLCSQQESLRRSITRLRLQAFSGVLCHSAVALTVSACGLLQYSNT